MTDAVDQTLQLWRSTPFIYGQSDCMLSVGDHIHRNGGRDVSGEFRGRYDDEAGALAFMSEAGGPGALIERTGWQRVDGPKRGDAVVVHVGGIGIGGICTGDAIAVRLARGVAEISLRLVRISGAWSCPF